MTRTSATACASLSTARGDSRLTSKELPMLPREPPGRAIALAKVSRPVNTEPVSLAPEPVHANKTWIAPVST